MRSWGVRGAFSPRAPVAWRRRSSRRVLSYLACSMVSKGEKGAKPAAVEAPGKRCFSWGRVEGARPPGPPLASGGRFRRKGGLRSGVHLRMRGFVRGVAKPVGREGRGAKRKNSRKLPRTRETRVHPQKDGEDEMPKQLVKDLEPGEEVKSVFVVTRKELRKTKMGAPYLAIELADKSGKVDARIWENAARYKDAFAEQDYVAVSGRVERYRDQVQVVINSLRRCSDEEVDVSDFLRVVETDRAELEGELRQAADEVRDFHLKGLLLNFLNDPEFMRRFTTAPAAKNYHHPYLGGLLEHTANTVRICRMLCAVYPEVDGDLLVTAAILHDIGKIYELEYERSIDFSDAGRFLGHLLLADEMIREKISVTPGFPPDLAMRLRHAVLSHHGELEWGSPKRPKTLEAIILHHVDNLDAKVNSFREILERTSDSDSAWTDMRNLFKRPLYNPRAASREEEDLGLEEDLPR